VSEPGGRCSVLQLALPLQDRRLSVRRRVRIVALLHCPRLVRTVVIEDYSHDGLRLVSSFPANMGERVTVELLSGARLPAQVVWVAGTHIGVRFLAVRPGHPGLLALWEAIRRHKSRAPPDEAA
jgi:hypothetical protein